MNDVQSPNPINVEEIRGYRVVFKENNAFATFIGDPSHAPRFPQELIDVMKGRGFACLFSLQKIVYFRKKK
jgi:hypothetical protein